MELKYLYTVKKIIETGSYQAAAAALNYAQSTITFQIKQLESELSIQLFEKSGNKMMLTQAGKEVLPLIEKVLASVEELLCFNDMQSNIGGELIVALPETLVTYQIQPVLERFKEEAPNVNLSLRVLNCYSIVDLIAKGDIHIAIHYDVGKYSASVVKKEIGTYPLTLVCSPALEEVHRDFITPNQKKPICHIQNDRNALYLKIFNQYLRKKDILLKTELEVWSIEAVKRSVQSNLGVALLPRFTVAEELQQGLLCEIPTQIHNNDITAIYAYNRNRWQNPAMQLFLQILDGYYGKIAP